jgi:hypothetical protein
VTSIRGGGRVDARADDRDIARDHFRTITMLPLNDRAVSTAAASPNVPRNRWSALRRSASGSSLNSFSM